jgi:pyrimidine operon attenuation protein/uracil phosphoribosyltransferase
MGPKEIDRTLVRLAHEILERNEGTDNLALVGIHRRGVPLAERIAKHILLHEGKDIPVAAIEVTLYRDDLTTIAAQPVVKTKELDIEIAGQTIILVDDVLNSGRTARASMNALFDYGRPAKVHFCVLIDRGGRELPIEATYAGRQVLTTPAEFVEVRLQEVDGEERVVIVEMLDLD